jgi:hypothetical protein
VLPTEDAARLNGQRGGQARAAKYRARRAGSADAE